MWLNKLQEAYSRMDESIEPEMPSQLMSANTTILGKPYFRFDFYTSKNNFITVNISKPDAEKRIYFEMKVNHTYEFIERERDPEILNGFLGVLAAFIKKYPVDIAECEAYAEAGENRRVRLFSKILPKVFLPNVWGMTVNDREIIFKRL